MTVKEWFDRFDDTNEKFHWFFEEYGFGLEWDELLVYREVCDRFKMYDIMNNVWFYLPDRRFNIRHRPTGWAEFISLLEE